MIAPPPRPTLFPYTTLFRSISRRLHAERRPSVNAPRLSSVGAKLAGTTVVLIALATLGIYLRLSEYQRESLLRSEEHTSELQSRQYLVCRLLLEKKKSIHAL